MEQQDGPGFFTGKWVLVAALPGSRCCPVLLVRTLLTEGQYVVSTQDADVDLGPLLRPVLAVPGGGHRLKMKTSTLPALVPALSASRLRDHLQEMCKQAGIGKHIGLHSCRIGGATAAANNSVEDRLFQKHGRWASEGVKNGYVRESLAALLSVSSNLGL